MSLKDRFRIDELIKKGSKAIRRDDSGRVIVRKKDGKQIPEGYERGPNGKIVRIKKEKPYGTEPIKTKQVNPRFKEDLNIVDDSIDENQSSFSGETSGYVERPYYEEEELRKAVDVTIDELVKEKKPSKKKYILRKKFDDLLNSTSGLSSQVAGLERALSQANGSIESLNGRVQEGASLVESANQARDAAQEELNLMLERYNVLLKDFQNSVIKGTKEGIERVSLTAQVRGLQAQKETLKAQLKAQEDIVQSLQQQAETQAAVIQQAQQQAETVQQASFAADLSGPTNSFDKKGNAGWKIPEANITKQKELDEGNHFRYSGGKWDNGSQLVLYNFSEEPITYSINYTLRKGGHSQVWVGGPRSVSVPARVETRAGEKTITFSRKRAPGNGDKDDNIIITASTGEKFTLKARHYKKKSGKIICNELYNQGYLSKEIWEADEDFGEWLWDNHRQTAIGYTIWARKVVQFMRRNPRYTKYIYKLLKPWTIQMAYQMGVVEKTHPLGWLTMNIGWKFSNFVYLLYGSKFENVLKRLNNLG